MTVLAASRLPTTRDRSHLSSNLMARVARPHDEPTATSGHRMSDARRRKSSA